MKKSVNTLKKSSDKVIKKTTKVKKVDLNFENNNESKNEDNVSKVNKMTLKEKNDILKSKTYDFLKDFDVNEPKKYNVVKVREFLSNITNEDISEADIDKYFKKEEKSIKLELEFIYKFDKFLFNFINTEFDNRLSSSGNYTFEKILEKREEGIYFSESLIESFEELYYDYERLSSSGKSLLKEMKQNFMNYAMMKGSNE